MASKALADFIDENRLPIVAEWEAFALSLTPAVALSAYAQDACRDAALAAGFDMFLRKPLDVTHFVPVLKALLHD